MILNDFVMLGRSEPSKSKKYGLSVCSAGYSMELDSFIRVYPLPKYSKIKKWSVCIIKLIRNKSDSRKASWRLDNDSTNDESCINVSGKQDKESAFDYLLSKVSTIEELNQNKESLGIIKPESFEPHFINMKPREECQINLFSDPIVAGKFRPKIKFNNHDIQLLDWGCYEFIRKHINTGNYPPETLWDNLKLNNENYEHLFFVGNQLIHQNNWQIISVISRKKITQQELF